MEGTARSPLMIFLISSGNEIHGFCSPVIHCLHMYCLFLHIYETLEASLKKIALIFTRKF